MENKRAIYDLAIEVAQSDGFQCMRGEECHACVLYDSCQYYRFAQIAYAANYRKLDETVSTDDKVLINQVLDEIEKLAQDFSTTITSEMIEKKIKEIKEQRIGTNGRQMPCEFCMNAKFDDYLTDETDSASYSIGECEDGFRMMLTTGHRQPVRIEVEQWNEKWKRWVTIGIFYPKRCPVCGRLIDEFSNEKNRNRKDGRGPIKNRENEFFF